MSSLFDERIVADESAPGILAIHLKRYVFAADYVWGKEVLDVACGTGYGSDYLADFAGRVTGVDLSREAVAYAKERYRKTNLGFDVMDACRLNFPERSFETIVSFETIEHLRDPAAFLAQVSRVMKEDGFFLVSTPCAQKTSQAPENPFHYQEWTVSDFKALLESYFGSVRLFGQRRRQSTLHRWLQRADFLGLRKRWKLPAFMTRLSYAVNTTPFAEMRLDDIEIVEDDFSDALYTIAVCSKPRKKDQP